MSLTWPWALTALLVVPLLLAVRWWMNRRRRRLAVRVSSAALIRAALPGRTSWRRRIPVILFVAALLALAVGATRPQASVPVPSDSTTIMLAIDVSRSMCSTDVPPNRLIAARQAARQFVRAYDGQARIGLVAFSGISGVLVQPTTDQDALLAAIDNLRTARGTAIGLGMLTAVNAIAEVNPDVAPTGVDLGTPAPATGEPAGGYEPDVIVVLTDGVNTQGVDPVTAAEQVAARRLRVYTIGFGTTQPAPFVCTADQIDGGAGGGDGRGRFGGGGGGGGRNQQIDEESLRKVADLTGGEYFRAQDAEQLNDVLTDLPRTIVVQREQVEISVWFVAVGALLAGAAVGLSLRWNRSSGVASVSR